MSYLVPSRQPSRRPGGGRAMGDAASPGGPFAELARQVNRFGPGAPASFQFTQKTFPLASGTLDPELAVTAAAIYQRRAADAFSQFHDAGSASAIDQANQALANPAGYISAHLSDVTTQIGLYADSIGLPAADAHADTVTPILGSELPPTVALAAVALLVWSITKMGRRGR